VKLETRSPELCSSIVLARSGTAASSSSNIVPAGSPWPPLPSRCGTPFTSNEPPMLYGETGIPWTRLSGSTCLRSAGSTSISPATTNGATPQDSAKADSDLCVSPNVRCGPFSEGTPYCTGAWEIACPGPTRILVTESSERNVFRSGSSSVREFASLRIASRLISRWRWLDSVSSAR
jgi:hypothetical protein